MRSICIVGFAPETRELVHELPESTELWGMNVNHKFMKRWDRWFQLHPETWEGRPFYGRAPEHVEFLKTCGVPLYMNYPLPDFPTAIAYPEEEVAKSIGRRYMTSTVANAMALAIHEEVDEILIYGVNLASNTEYVEQRPCAEWLTGLAEGRGIKVVWADESPVMRGEQYPGEANSSPRGLAQKRLDDRRMIYHRYWQKIHQSVGAIWALEQLQENLPVAIQTQVQSVIDQYRVGSTEQAAVMNNLKGHVSEAKFWLAQAGGFDRHASVMLRQQLPPGFFAPDVEEKIRDANIGEENFNEEG